MSTQHLSARLHALPRDSRDTLFLLCVVAACLVPLAGEIPTWSLLMAATLLLWRGWLAWRQRPLPGRWVMAALLALAVALTWRSYRTILGPDAGVTLVAMLLALKTLELRARRDAMVVFFLGLFTLLANFFFSQSLATALLIVLALMGLLTTLVNVHRIVGRPPLIASLRTAVALAAMGTPVMLALFLLFPRMAPLWSLPADKMSGLSGLSGEMHVGDLAQLALDDSVALRVRFDTPGGQPPPQSSLYFRGPVLSAFNGRDWYALGTPQAQTTTWAAPAPARLSVAGPPLRYEVTLEPSQRSWLFTLDAALQPPGMPHGWVALMAPDLHWRTTRPIVSVLRYQAQSHLQFRHGPQQADASLHPYLQLPPQSDPRTRQWAAQLRADPQLTEGGTPALVGAVLQHLHTGDYRYTLQPGVYGEDTADTFWFDRQAGFCEHIASAFVVLMRAMEIPARIVTGYQGGQMNTIDGYWTVRQSDAHAWAEVWMHERGWVRVDPTAAIAPERIERFERLQAPRGALGTAVRNVVAPGLLLQLRALWEAADNRWNQWVLNYTQESQLDLLKALGMSAPDWRDLVRLLGLGVLGAAALIGGWALWERHHHNPWQRLLTRTRARLARAGLALPPHLPARSLATQAHGYFGGDADDVVLWLLALEQARFSDHPERSLRQLQRQWRRLRWPAPGRAAVRPETPQQPSQHPAPG